jgi:hypothetical protein
MSNKQKHGRYLTKTIKHLNFIYIYPVSYKIAKGQTLEKGFDHLEKNVIKNNLEPQNVSTIVGICRLQKQKGRAIADPSLKYK